MVNPLFDHPLQEQQFIHMYTQYSLIDKHAQMWSLWAAVKVTLNNGMHHAAHASKAKHAQIWTLPMLLYCKVYCKVSDCHLHGILTPRW